MAGVRKERDVVESVHTYVEMKAAALVQVRATFTEAICREFCAEQTKYAGLRARR